MLDAHQILDRSIVHSSLSWNILISGYVKHGNPHYAIGLYQRTQEIENVYFNSCTLVALLKACVTLSIYEKGTEVHSEIARMGLLEKNLFVNSCLVDMYAKFGLPIMAQEVFDKLVHRDVVIWTALIACLTEAEYAEKAIKCFERMQLEGISPDFKAFTSVLRACGKSRDIIKGHEVHVKVCEVGGSEGNVFIGSTLVDMYAKCGTLTYAHEVFDKLMVRNDVSWTTLIKGYIEVGFFEDAMNCFEQMQLEGVCPDSVTFICILNSCSSMFSEQKCLQVHAEIGRLQFRNDHRLGCALVEMYGRIGALQKAHEVFEYILVKDVDAWNALIAAYGTHGCVDDTVRCFKEMEAEGISPNLATYVSLSKAYIATEDINKATEVLAEIQVEDLSEVDAITGSSLIDAYAKCGLMEKATKVFDKLPSRNIVTWNTLITACVENGCNKEALCYFDQMQCEGVFPDAVTFICCLKACGNLVLPNRVNELYSQIKRLGLLDRDQVGNTLVLAFARCGLLNMAWSVFSNLLYHSEVSWTALIAGYAEHGLGEEALGFLEQMQQDGIYPDVFTFIHSLKACSDIGAVDKAEELFAEIERQGLLEESLILGNSLLDVYAKCGSLRKAQEVFDNLKAHDLVTWNTLIAAYAENGCGKDAVKCYEQMLVHGVTPDAITLVCVLKACGNIGARRMGYAIQGEIEKLGLVQRDHFVCSTLVDIYAKWGLLEEAQVIFDVLPFRDVVIWNTLMSAYGQYGRSGIVFGSFNKMLGDGIKPDPVTFVIVLSACRRAGLLLKSQTYFEVMSKGFGIYPMPDHHNCMVNLLGHAGDLDMAITIIRKMPYHPSLKVWHTFLKACRNCGSMEFGRLAFQDALHLML
ncbi:hypothetical protein KP509_30G013800 [Ceratopteris richardii]|nr:hypothetical protein KP509_30G013800 [Ceratopteris richardii]